MTEQRRPRQVHPFPARMAPELALAALDRAPDDAVVLDPMCGSGTVLQHARDQGKSAFGYDIDPLAVLVTRVTCTHVNSDRIQRAASDLVESAQSAPLAHLPWLDLDPATSAFVDFWFHAKQQAQLRQLASALHGRTGKIADVLRIALSRTIITKDAGASLARDVSHSRPHRVRETNDFDVYQGFLKAVNKIAPLVDTPGQGKVSVSRRDARRLPPSLRGRIDLVVTSPPYLNAIDYMRGHRMSLVWLGYQLGQLTQLRSNSVGAERYPDKEFASLNVRAPRHRGLSAKQHGMLDRYAGDVNGFMGQIAQVLSPRGEAVLVVGDSTLSGTYVRNSLIVRKAAQRNGLVLIGKKTRTLPTSSRYLPPPASTDGSLSKRMRHEVIMRFGRDSTRVGRRRS
jgi:DNA modification methylase